MKHLKSLMLALTVLMGISLTSCLGDSDPTVTMRVFGQVTEIFPTLTVKEPSGYTYHATNSIADLSIMPGDYIYFQYSYNSEEQPRDPNKKNYDAEIIPLEKMTHKYVLSGVGQGETHESATVLQLGDGPQAGINGTKFLYYDANKVVLPLIFLLEEASQESLNKHTFELVYDETKAKPGDADITFYLRHYSPEKKTSKSALSWKIFDIASAVTHFKNVVGSKPQHVIIMVNETKNVTSDKLEDKKDALTEYKLPYSEYFPN